MKNFGKVFCLAAVTSLALAAAAHAADLTGGVAVTSNYVSRGTAQNLHGGGAIQGFATYAKGDFYASTFASTMNYREGSTEELDFFVGWRPKAGNFQFDVSAANINYPNNPTPLNFTEFGVKVDHPVGKGSVGAWVGYTQHYFNTYGKGTWTEVHGSYPLTDKLSVSGGVARQNLPNNWDYGTYNVGATYTLPRNVSVDLRYSDTDKHYLDPYFNSYDGQVSLSVTKTF